MTGRIFYLSEEFAEYMPFLPYEVKPEIEECFREKKYYHCQFSLSLAVRKISFNEVKNIIGSILLPYDEVRFEMFPEETLSNYFSFGDSNFYIFGGTFEDNPTVVEWMECYINLDHVKTKTESIIQVLYLIGLKFKFLLLDWKHRKIMELDSKEKIALYLINTFVADNKT